jgi:hypothetical protein
MHPHAVGRQILHRGVERLDIRRDDFAVVGDADAGIERVGHGEVGAVELQDEAGRGDRVVLLFHRVGQRAQVCLLVLVVPVGHKPGDDPG